MEVRYAPLDWRLSCGILVGVATTLAVRSIVSDELDWSEPQSGRGRATFRKRGSDYGAGKRLSPCCEDHRSREGQCCLVARARARRECCATMRSVSASRMREMPLSNASLETLTNLPITSGFNHHARPSTTVPHD